MVSPDKIVTARVPREIRDQGDIALRRIDSTVTELVNSAFEYVIKTGSLPTPSSKSEPNGKTNKRKLSAKQKARFSEYLETTSVPLSREYSSLSAKEIKAMRLAEKYEG